VSSIVVIYYSKPECPYCVKLEKLLAARSIPNIKLTLDKDFTRADFQALSETKLTFPQAFVAGERIGGYDDFCAWLERNHV
jgi:glutaredoxin